MIARLLRRLLPDSLEVMPYMAAQSDFEWRVMTESWKFREMMRAMIGTHMRRTARYYFSGLDELITTGVTQ